MDSVLSMRVRLLPASQAACLLETLMNAFELMAAVRGVLVTREIRRLMPASHKAEPVAQRRNPARAAKKGAK
jgi:hypothetical protein